MVNYVKNADLVKPVLLPFLPGEAPEEPTDTNRVVELIDTSNLHMSVPQCRLRAALEATLLLAEPELGVWALELPGGVPQLHFLVSTGK